MRTVGEVIRWWLSRIEGDRTRSASYRASMASLMNRHVLPRLDKVRLGKLDRGLPGDKLGFPMHQEPAPRAGQKGPQGKRPGVRLAEGPGRTNEDPPARP